MLYSPPVVEPMGERRSAWWIISQLMRRMGLPVPDDVPHDDRIPGADDAMLARLMTGARCGFDELRDKRPGDAADSNFRALGSMPISNGSAAGGWPLPRWSNSGTRSAPPTRRAMRRRRAPLRFISRRQRRKLNASLSFLGSPADVILHPDDARTYGVEDGQRVRVWTSSGEIVLTANVSDTIRRGVASIPHGHETANVNLLTSVDHVDPHDRYGALYRHSDPDRAGRGVTRAAAGRAPTDQPRHR